MGILPQKADQITVDCPALQEWRSSSIADSIFSLNVQELSYTEDVFGFLTPKIERRNDGRLTDRYMRRFISFAGVTGWKCTGINILKMTPSEWGCFKPDQPIEDENGKIRKYEHPAGVPTEIFALRVTWAIGLKCAQRQGLEAEYKARMPEDVDMDAEDTSFWKWVLDTPKINVAITEGAKKAGALLTVGCVAIALPGIYGGYRSKKNGVEIPPHLIPQLEVFAAKGRQITFVFDNDTKPGTVQKVRKAIGSTGRLMAVKGCEVSVMAWKTPQKGIDDFIVANGEDAFWKAFNGRLSLNAWKVFNAFDLSDLPCVRVNSRYLEAAQPPKTANFIAVKSAKGTGKTEWIGKLLEGSYGTEARTLAITHRIQLSNSLSARLGIPSIEKIRTHELGSLLGQAMCIDSLHPKSQARFNYEDWSGANVVIDEVEQVLWHLFNSETCRGSRAAILETFGNLLKHIVQTGGRLIIADADLSRVSIEYLQELAGCHTPHLLINDHIPNKGKRQLIQYSDEGTMLKAILGALEEGQNIIIHCSAQRTKSKYSAINLEALIRQHYPEIKLLRVDAETVADPTHPAYGCVENINRIFPAYQVVIASPTIETGVSVDVKHFDSVWQFVNGVQTVDAVCQTLERVRADVDRHICVNTKAIQRIGNGGTNPYSLIKSEQKLFQANFNLLSKADELARLEGQHQSSLKTWSLYASKINTGYLEYEPSILAKLQAEGYQLLDYSPPPKLPKITVAQIENDLEAAREDNYKAEREVIIGTENPCDTDYQRLKKQRKKTPLDRAKLAKGELVRRYKTEDIDDDLILKNDAGWYPRIQLHYYLTMGRKHLQARDKTKLTKLSEDGTPFKPDGNRVCLSTKIKTLELLDITQFFGEDKTFTKDNLVDWHKKVMGYRSNIKDVLGITINSDATPITVAQQLLGTLGLKLEYQDQIRVDGKPVRRYTGVTTDPDQRSPIFDRWLAAEEAEKAKCHTETINSKRTAECDSKSATHPPHDEVREAAAGVAGSVAGSVAGDVREVA